jgi:hypothetical protein
MKKMRQTEETLLGLGVLSAFCVSLALGGCAQDNPKTQQQQKAAQTLIQNAAGNLNPTNTTPTDLEGTWLSPCVPGSYDNGAQGKTTGFVFIGNSFYKQVDLYWTTDCTWDTSQTLADARAGGSMAAGWFATAPDQNSAYKDINMESAPNFGSRYELNIYAVNGSGSGKLLYMGDPAPYSTVRPTQPTVQYVHWDTTTFAQ